MMKNILSPVKCGLFLLFIIVTGCSKNDDGLAAPDVMPETELQASGELISSLTTAELQTRASTFGLASLNGLIQYDVDFYRFTYNTEFNNKEISASGLLCIPKGMATVPVLLSAQHGTIFSDAEAPSNFPQSASGLEFLASSGYITIIPDYIGYGVSKDVLHPYYDMPSSGRTVVDMIKAVKYFLKTKSITFSDKLFLLGYSEGGYVTMAAQKEIETNAGHQLAITAAAEGAGAYDLSLMLEKIATTATYPDPSFFALFFQSYNTLYGFNRPLTNYFKQPYASRIPQLVDGGYNGGQINTQLTTSTQALFNEVFYSDLSKAGAETAFKTKVAQNTFTNWVPKSPTRLYHGTADKNVFIETSQSTYDRFTATGGGNNVSFIPVPGGTHQTTVLPMIQDALQWFSTLQQ